ncbi:hypothetical protein GCM10008983_06870 [Lentibacillus halophilus]|uniref:DUF4179 domain-containing protein n=1 Tax=Lentibacillus halophilus TaxID=295065 RepID=A0ABN0Z585_9BACI
MTKQNNSWVDHHLSSMPKPSVSQDKHQEIKQTIMNDKKPGTFRRYSAIAGTAAACFIVFLLAITFINSQQRMTMQSFSEIISGDIAKIAGTDGTNDYVSDSNQILQAFHEATESIELVETDTRSKALSQSITLYDNEGDKMADIQFGDEAAININGTYYRTGDGELKAFTDVFFTEKYATGKQLSTRKQAYRIIDLLMQKNMNKLMSFVHPEKGLRFSPHVSVSADDVTIPKHDIPGLLDQEDTYTWGIKAGKGSPIEMTPNDYIEEYVRPQLFTPDSADTISINEIKQRGNTRNTILDMYPSAETVEFYNDGSADTEMDWRSLTLVFQNYNGKRKLVAIVNNQWSP